MPRCRKCGQQYKVVCGDDEGLCSSCLFDELVEDDNVRIFTMEQVARGELDKLLGDDRK